MKGLGLTRIPYATYSWPLVTGCSPAGSACDHCFAARYAATRGKHLPQYAGLAVKHVCDLCDDPCGAVEYHWTGEVRFHPEQLDRPLHTKKPGRVFTVPTGDLFHDGVTDLQIGRALDVMEQTPHLMYIVVTKRMERLQKNIVEVEGWGRTRNPLPNVALVPTVWDQESADRVIPLLLDTPAAMRGVSYEPALGAVDLTKVVSGTDCRQDVLNGGIVWKCAADDEQYNEQGYAAPRLDLVIAGPETGPGARPCDPAWLESAHDQCVAAGVAYFDKREAFKHWRDWPAVAP